MGVNLNDLKQENSSHTRRQRRNPVIDIVKEYSASSESKKEAQEAAEVKKLNATIKQLDENIAKTDKVLANPKYNLNATMDLSEYAAKISLTNNPNSFTKMPHKLDFLSLRGNPKRLLNYIIINLNNEGAFSIDTKDLIEALGLENMILKSSIQRLRSRGFIRVTAIRGVPHRMFVVNPSILFL